MSSLNVECFDSEVRSRAKISEGKGGALGSVGGLRVAGFGSAERARRQPRNLGGVCD
jgi:hypothetical protein